MGIEVERKFLVETDQWQAAATSSTRIVQGYLARTDTTTVRVRIRGERAFLTIKGKATGIARSEFEYEIPTEDAMAMLDELSAGPLIDKVRHLVPVADHVWEVDVFAGANAPLVLAEVELSASDEQFQRPDWVGEDVSHDSRYYNVNLACAPYGSWAPRH